MSEKSEMEKEAKLPKLLQSCKELFKTTDLYEVLGIRKEATPQEVKKGYYKTSLSVHPDRVEGEEKEMATKKFQIVSRVYCILSHEETRSTYDETGEVGEEDDSMGEKDWGMYWRLIFPKITVKDIQEFEEKYKGSEQETEDLKQAYLESEGDMNIIMERVLCCTMDDEDRFTATLKELVEKGELPEFKAFTAENEKKKADRKKHACEEAKEAEEEAKKLKLDDTEDSLAALIRQRSAARAKAADNFFDNLEAKYCKPQKGKKKKK